MANVRGTVLLRVVKLLRSQRERVLPSVPPSLQHYLHERISVAAWYPADDYFELLRGREARVTHHKCVTAGHGTCEWRIGWKPLEVAVAARRAG